MICFIPMICLWPVIGDLLYATKMAALLLIMQNRQTLWCQRIFKDMKHHSFLLTVSNLVEVGVCGALHLKISPKYLTNENLQSF